MWGQCRPLAGAQRRRHPRRGRCARRRTGRRRLLPVAYACAGAHPLAAFRRRIPAPAGGCAVARSWAAVTVSAARPGRRAGRAATPPRRVCCAAPALRRPGAFAAPPSPARRGPLPQAALQMRGGAPRRSTRLRRRSRRRRRRTGRTGRRAPSPRAGHALRGTEAPCLRLSSAISAPSCRTGHFCALSCRRLSYTRHDQPRTLSCRKTRLCG